MSQLLQSIETASNDTEKEAIITQALNKMWHQEQREQWSQQLDQQFGIKRLSESKKPKTKMFPLYKWVAVAASVLVLCMVVWQSSQQKLSTLSAQYIQESYINHPGLTKGTDELDIESKSQAIEAYRTKNFKAAIDLFSSINEKSEEDIFFTGISHMQLANYEEALGQFALLEASDNPRYDQELNWFKALTYIELNDHNLAIKQLNQIRPQDWKYEDAKKLIKALH